MEWTRSETIGLACPTCVFCRGLGLRRALRGNPERPCGCVFRAIFKACLEKFQRCIEKSGYTSAVSADRVQGPIGNRMFGRKNEEFIADFELTARRSLRGQEYDLFKWHYLYGADFRLCCIKMNIDKGTFYHLVYVIQEKLGRVFREMQPYALFPLDVYFGGETPRKARSGLGRRIETPEQRAAEEIRQAWMSETSAPKPRLLQMPKRSEDTVASRFPLRTSRKEKKIA